MIIVIITIKEIEQKCNLLQTDQNADTTLLHSRTLSLLRHGGTLKAKVSMIIGTIVHTSNQPLSLCRSWLR